MNTTVVFDIYIYIYYIIIVYVYTYLVRLGGMLMYEYIPDAIGRPIGRDWNGVCMGGYMNVDMTVSGMAPYSGQLSHNYIYICMCLCACVIPDDTPVVMLVIH